jgi:glutathione S-transferase
MSHPQFKLISHKLCPFVQRAVIVLKEKGISFERVDIDLGNKPVWFVELSPLGKVPLLVIGGGKGDVATGEPVVLFESAVISEYIDTVIGGSLLSTEPLQRAHQRAWIEYASSLVGNIGQLYNANNTRAYNDSLDQLEQKWQRLEDNLPSGPYFTGESFSLVDAAFAPALRYLDVFESLTQKKFLNAYPKVQSWRFSLSKRRSVQQAVSYDYDEALLEFIARRDSILGNLAREAFTEKPQAVGF